MFFSARTDQRYLADATAPCFQTLEVLCSPNQASNSNSITRPSSSPCSICLAAVKAVRIIHSHEFHLRTVDIKPDLKVRLDYKAKLLAVVWTSMMQTGISNRHEEPVNHRPQMAFGTQTAGHEHGLPLTASTWPDVHRQGPEIPPGLNRQPMQRFPSMPAIYSRHEYNHTAQPSAFDTILAKQNEMNAKADEILNQQASAKQEMEQFKKEVEKQVKKQIEKQVEKFSSLSIREQANPQGGTMKKQTIEFDPSGL
ncbi:hypothetical protein C8J56DRAFT_895374 [Mycena floridula]|nr:hypothetical protein C8J56DRAFT_895374 [Mycena floridula]